MPTIIPQNELVRRALTWIAGELAANSRRTAHDLADEAGMRFNLTPLEGEMLLRCLAQEGNTRPDAS
jgi:hypothetical protein